jgi:DNA-nicking Smr family endonuclease
MNRKSDKAMAEKKKDSDEQGIFRPFENLKSLLEKKSVSVVSKKTDRYAPIIPTEIEEKKDAALVHLNIEKLEQRLFEKAMSGVKPISKEKYAEKKPRPVKPKHKQDSPQDNLNALETLVKTTQALVIRTMEDYLRLKGYKFEFEVEELERFYYDLVPGFFRPFEGLNSLLRRRQIYALPQYAPRKKKTYYSTVETDEQAYRKAMQGVTPIVREKCFQPDEKEPEIQPSRSVDIESLRALENLVKYGYGFTVSDTSEYIEGSGSQMINPELIRRLHRGDFSIQAHLDLHGLDVEHAQEAFDKFLAESVLGSRRTILVVHGRGLSSPIKPVLKNKVCDWLTRGPWRKWVIAFSSARSCDGGAGATYILLRHKPLTKRFRKKHKGDQA